MTEIHYFPLQLEKKEWLRYYKGEATNILVKTTSGLKISVPARHFHRFTTSQGLYGFFQITLKGNRMIALKEIS